MITEAELDVKYPDGTPVWRKDGIERFICNKHGLPTIWVRDADVVVHSTTDTECC